MSDSERPGGHNFQKGKVVYFVERRTRAWVPIATEEGWEAVENPQPILTARKGVVERVDQPGFRGLYWPQVQVWTDPNQEPKFSWTSACINPLELFREDDVQQALEEQEHHLRGRPLEEVLIYRESNTELATILGALILVRTAEQATTD